MSTMTRQNAAPVDHGVAGKAVLVTGGGSGLGQAICRVLSEAGAHLAVADIRLNAAETTARSLNGAGRAKAIHLDAGDETAAGRAIQETVEMFGQLDVLVNNAGVDVTLPVEELSFAEFDRVLRTNLRGPFVMAKRAFPVMRRQGGGYIVNIVSTAALRAWANASAYHASKWGLLGLSHALHVEGRPAGIKVTAVIAGGMRTPFLLDRFPDLDPAALQDPANVAATVRFVISQPAETVIPEIMVLPARESSWP